MIHAQQADPAQLDQSCQGRRRPRLTSLDQDLVVGDQTESPVDQPQQQVRLTATGLTKQQDADPVSDGAAAMEAKHPRHIRSRDATLELHRDKFPTTSQNWVEVLRLITQL